MNPSPSLTLPGSAIFSSGRRKGGNSADMNPSPSLTLAVSIIFPSGRRKVGNGSGRFVADMVFLRGRTDPNSVSRRNLALFSGDSTGKKLGGISGKTEALSRIAELLLSQRRRNNAPPASRYRRETDAGI